MGRKRTPTAQRELEGNPAKRPLNPDEPVAVAGLPTCPKHIRGEARREWNRMGRRLISEKRMAFTYKAAFAVYCVAWGRWVDAEKQLEEFGTVILTNQEIDKKTGQPIGGGNLVQSPYLAVSNRAMAQIMKALGELGMSPTSQSRVSKVKHPATVTRLEAFIARSHPKTP